MVEGEILSNIIDLVHELRGLYKIQLSRSTRVSQDLNIEGDDAYEFLQTFSDRFNVDLTNFNFDKYFCYEAFNLIIFFSVLFKKKKYKTLTLGDLERAVKAGKWIEEE